MSSIATKRLSKEIKELLDPEKGPPVGIKVLNADDLKIWTLSIEVLGESVYQGEVFVLRFTFTDRYPMESPEVVFLVNEEYQAPIHPHVYSNGHICASILGSEWSPVLNTASVCITLQSMLASCKKKERPIDNDRYVRSAPLSPKQTRFHYDDDTV
ncbi:ubiquitin-conjugating enzyme E2 W [Rhizoctonia solani]|uniref:Ubiquitin-conjugating enzyme E2 W n=1 Tax=Rhizoctonia solani TaxID=456999 RepID=A0A0K6G528_9AGAM|nr:ubiquitin-conjugating enzyme E2 W [Rhizoctonia solani]